MCVPSPTPHGLNPPLCVYLIARHLCVQRSVLLRPKYGPSQVSTPEAAAGVLYTALQGWFVYWMHSDTNLLKFLLICMGLCVSVYVCVCLCVYV